MMQRLSTSSTRSVLPSAEVSAEERERIADGVLALFRFLWEFDRGAGYLEALEESRMTLPQLKALVALSSAEGPLSVKELGEQLGLSAPAATRVVDALVERRLASRSEDPADRRVRLIAATPSGAAIVEEFASRRTEGLEALAERLTPAQRRKLVAAFDALLESEDFRGLVESNRRAASR